MNNTKVFLVASFSVVSTIVVGLRLDCCSFTQSKRWLLWYTICILQKSVEGRIDFDGFESHDSGSLMEVIGRGVWMNRVLHVCRTGEPIPMPDTFRTDRWPGSSIWWQTIGQEYIVSNSIFRKCGLRSNEFDQYDKSPTRGCADDGSSSGCSDESSVFYYQSVSFSFPFVVDDEVQSYLFDALRITQLKDNMLPEIVQATKNITFDNCGRRFMSISGDVETGQAILENWSDTDGSVSGLGEYTYMVSGMPRARSWWDADEGGKLFCCFAKCQTLSPVRSSDIYPAIVEPQRPSYLIRKGDGPKRGLGFIQMTWDASLHDQVGKNRYCYQGWEDCPDQGYIRHLGRRFSPDPEDYTAWGLPVTAAGRVVGLTGGYGWLMEFSAKGAPKELVFDRMEIDPESVLMLSIKYPRGTTFKVTAGARLCSEKNGYYCFEEFEQTDDIEEVRRTGNRYHVDPSGVVT